jgi:hypothetical protein
MLRIGFQNVGGFTLNKNKHKDDTIRHGIKKWEFDIFGVAETNIDWRLLKEQDRLHQRTKGWFESVHISYANNCTATPLTAHQWGGTATLSLNQAAHRVSEKGRDNTNLGRWCWTRYRGKNNHTLRVITSYRPNPPSGPLSVYAQQRSYFNHMNDDRCPRVAFLQDICAEIQGFMEAGDHIIVLIDGNTDMKHSDLRVAFERCNLREVLLERHGYNGPSTFRWNNTNTPIDGIWASVGINISRGGYFPFDGVFINTDHRCLWMDVTFVNAFGHNLPAISRPAAQRLHCRDPRVVANYQKRYEKLAIRYKLRERAVALDNVASYPPSMSLQYEYETLDQIRCEISAHAERRCRKLRMGQVAFSPPVQKAHRSIKAWSVILKKSKGMKVSSRLLQRSMRKANLDKSMKHVNANTSKENLKQAYKHYYSIKGSDRDLRKTYLEELVEALCAMGNVKKETTIKQIKEREQQRDTAKKIKYLQGKINTGSITTITIEDGKGSYIDIVGKEQVEKAIMANNEQKYKQSHHTPFFQFPLAGEFGFKGLTPASQAVLAALYESNHEIDSHVQGLLPQWQMPQEVRDIGRQSLDMTIESYRNFWRKAKENTSCFPDALSFSTMKAGASSEMISTIDCLQAKKMQDMATKWADAMRSGRISRQEAWIAITSTIWKSLLYPLSATNLSKVKCEQIMAPILKYGLPAIGVCRNFPRSMVFAPIKYTGLGFQHLHTMQEIARLKEIIQHTFRRTITGQLYRTSMELLYIEIGSTRDLHKLSFSTMSSLTTDSLVKSSWYFLNQNGIQLRHDISMPPQRVNDKPIMEYWIDEDIPIDILQSLNRCRLFLHAFYVSDIADGFGTHISDDSWNGKRSSSDFKTETWPAQGSPKRSDWEMWRKYIKKYKTHRGLRLKNPLGAWIQHDSEWPWYYSPEDERLYRATKNGWIFYSKVHKRKHRPVFSNQGIRAETLPKLCRASVYQNGSFWVCSGFDERF